MTTEALKEIIVENCMSTLKWARRLMVEEGQLQYLTMTILDDGSIMMYSYKGSLDINVYDKLSDDMRADILRARIKSLKEDVEYLSNELRLANEEIDDLESMRSDAIATAEENVELQKQVNEYREEKWQLQDDLDNYHVENAQLRKEVDELKRYDMREMCDGKETD